MAKKVISGIADQAVNRFLGPEVEPSPDQAKEQIIDEMLSDVRKSPAGRKSTIKRETTNSSQDGLQENWTRATFIMREDLLKRLKDYAYTDRRSLKAILSEMLEAYLDGKEIIERDGK